MSRPAEEVLEFGTLKGIVSGFTTCAPGRRATEALVPGQDVALLRAEFALVDEAIAYFRGGSELGFGSLVDPEEWLARLAIPASVLSSAQLLEAATLTEAVSFVRQTFQAESFSESPITTATLTVFPTK